MYLLLTIKSNKTHGKEGSVLVAQLIQGVVDVQGGNHLPDVREGSEQSNGDQSAGGRVDTEWSVKFVVKNWVPQKNMGIQRSNTTLSWQRP